MKRADKIVILLTDDLHPRNDLHVSCRMQRGICGPLHSSCIKYMLMTAWRVRESNSAARPICKGFVTASVSLYEHAMCMTLADDATAFLECQICLAENSEGTVLGEEYHACGDTPSRSLAGFRV